MFPDRQLVQGILRWICLILMGGALALPWVFWPMLGAFFTVSVGEPVSLSRDWQGEVWVVPEVEKVLAPASGSVTLLAQHGQWVASGSVLAEIVGPLTGPQLVYAPCGGLVSLHLANLPPRIGGSRLRRRDGDQMDAEAVVMGIVRSSVICLKLESSPFGPTPAEGARVLVAESSDKATASQWLEATGYLDDGQALSIYLNRFPETWLDIETMRADIRIEGPKGHIVPKTAIVSSSMQPAVWVIHQGDMHLRVVSILDQVGAKVVVSGLVSDDQVVTRPWLIPRALRWRKVNSNGRNQ